MQDYYGELLLQLLINNWDAQHFWFDWRKDINGSAQELNAKINSSGQTLRFTLSLTRWVA
jgi:hypothetical protein